MPDAKLVYIVLNLRLFQVNAKITEFIRKKITKKDNAQKKKTKMTRLQHNINLKLSKIYECNNKNTVNNISNWQWLKLELDSVAHSEEGKTKARVYLTIKQESIHDIVHFLRKLCNRLPIVDFVFQKPKGIHTQ